MLIDLLIAIALYAVGYVIRFAALQRRGGFRLPEILQGNENNTFRPLGLDADDNFFAPLGDGQTMGRPVCWVCGQPKARGTHADCR